MRFKDIFPDLRRDGFDGPFEDRDGFVFYEDAGTGKEWDGISAMKEVGVKFHPDDEGILRDYLDEFYHENGRRGDDRSRRSHRHEDRSSGGRQPSRRERNREVSASGNTPPPRNSSAARNTRSARPERREEEPMRPTVNIDAVIRLMSPGKLYQIARGINWNYSISDDADKTVVMTNMTKPVTISVADVLKRVQEAVQQPGYTGGRRMEVEGTFEASDVKEVVNGIYEESIRNVEITTMTSSNFESVYAYTTEMLAEFRDDSVSNGIKSHIAHAKRAIASSRSLQEVLVAVIGLIERMEAVGLSVVAHRIGLDVMGYIENISGTLLGSVVRFKDRSSLSKAAEEIVALDNVMDQQQHYVLFSTIAACLSNSLHVRIDETEGPSFFPVLPYSKKILAKMEIESDPEKYGPIEEHDLDSMSDEELAKAYAPNRIVSFSLCRRARIASSATSQAFDVSNNYPSANEVFPGLMVKETTEGLYPVCRMLAEQAAGDENSTPFQVAYTSSLIMELYSFRQTDLVWLDKVTTR